MGAAHSEPLVRTARSHAPRTRARAASASPERRAASHSPARCLASASSAARRARPVCARPPQMSSRPNHRPTCGGAQGLASALRIPEDADGVRRRGRTCSGVQRKRGCSRSAAPRARVSAAASANCTEKRPPVGTSRRGVQATRFQPFPSLWHLIVVIRRMLLSLTTARGEGCEACISTKRAPRSRSRGRCSCGARCSAAPSLSDSPLRMASCTADWCRAARARQALLRLCVPASADALYSRRHRQAFADGSAR